MRALLTITILLVSAGTCFAQTTPVFRPLEPDMTAPPRATVTTVPATPAQPTPQVQAAPLPVAHTGEVIDSEGSGAIPALPLTAQVQNGITFLSGGVSDEESEQLKLQENDYNLRLLITGQNGEFLSDLVVTLRNESGAALITVKDAGPCVYTQLPAGKYTVDVLSSASAAKTVAFTVPATGAVKVQIRI